MKFKVRAGNLSRRPARCGTRTTNAPSMTPLPLGSQLAKIAKAWKHDPLRPTLQMETFLTSLAAHPKLTPNAVRAAQALSNNVAQKKAPLVLVALQLCC